MRWRIPMILSGRPLLSLDAFLHDAKALGLKVADEYPAHMPRATDHVGRMMTLI